MAQSWDRRAWVIVLIIGAAAVFFRVEVLQQLRDVPKDMSRIPGPRRDAE